MNITLRKANAIQNSIQEAIKSIDVDTTIELNEFVDLQMEIKRANDELMLADTRRQKLLLALYNIRGLVGAANSQNGVDLNLTKAAFVDKRIAQLEDFARAKPMTDLSVITGKIEKIKNRKDDANSRIYGREDTVTTSLLTKEQIDQSKAEIKNLKKQKQKLNDEILELNIKTEIPLSDDVVETLTKEGIV